MTAIIYFLAYTPFIFISKIIDDNNGLEKNKVIKVLLLILFNIAYIYFLGMDYINNY